MKKKLLLLLRNEANNKRTNIFYAVIFKVISNFKIQVFVIFLWLCLVFFRRKPVEKTNNFFKGKYDFLTDV